MGSELVVVRVIDENLRDYVHVFDNGTNESYQQVQLPNFHRMLYGNSLYSGWLELDDIGDWILRNVIYSDLDVFYRDAIDDHKEELKIQERRQKHIDDIARIEDEQEILKLLLKKHDAGTQLARQASELRKIDTKNLTERNEHQRSLYLSAKLRASVSEDLHGLFLSMLAFFDLSKEEKLIFAYSKQRSDCSAIRNQRLNMFKLYLRKTKELYSLEMTDNEQNMNILMYRASRSQNSDKEKKDLEVLIGIIKRCKLEDKEAVTTTKKLIEKIEAEKKSANEQLQVLQLEFDKLNLIQIGALQEFGRQQLEMLKKKELRQSAQLLQSAAINEILYIHLGSAAVQVVRNEIIAGNILFEKIILDCDAAINNDYHGQVIDFLKVKEEHHELIPLLQHGLSSILMTFIFGSTEQMHRMQTILKDHRTDTNIAFEFIAEDNIRHPNSLLPIDVEYCKPISNYFDAVENVAVLQLLDDYLVLNNTDEQHDGAALARSNQRNVLCIKTNRIFYWNTTVKTVGQVFTPNEDDLFAERIPLIQARRLAKNLTETVLSIPTELNESLQAYVANLKEAEKKVAAQRGPIIQMQYKLDKLDGENFELQARLEKSKHCFMLNSAKLNRFKRIRNGFVNGFGDEVQLKEATTIAYRDRYLAKPLKIACSIKIQDIQKNIEKRNWMLKSNARQSKASFVTPEFEAAWNEYKTAHTRQQIDRNEKLVDLYNRNIAHVYSGHIDNFANLMKRSQELNTKVATVERLEKSLSELRKEKRTFLKNYKKWANHPMLLERIDWTVSQLNARLSEIQPQSGLQLGMRTSIDEQIKRIKTSTLKCLNVTTFMARIDRRLVQPIAYANFSGLNSVMVIANQFVQRLYNGRAIAMRLYLLLRDGECLLYDDYVTDMELCGPSAIVSVNFVLYEDQQVMGITPTNDKQVMAMCFYLATCMNNGVRPIVLVDNLSVFSANQQLEFLEILTGEPMLDRQRFCVTNKSHKSMENVQL